MVSVYDDPNGLQEVRCKSTDTKPDVANGSRCIEIDTHDVYYYDKETAQWDEAPTP